MNSILIIGAIVAFVLLIIGSAWWFEKKRTESLQQAATEMGLEFLPGGDAGLKDRLASFRLGSLGRARKCKNVISGDTGDIRITIFDYRYTTGSGKQQRTTVQTVSMLESDQLDVPSFSLRPENLLDRIGGALGLQQDIDFDEYPEFSKRYLLQGADESAIRAFFHSELIAAVMQKKNLCVEAAPGQVIVYQAGKKQSADRVRDLFSESLDYFNLLMQQERSAP